MTTPAISPSQISTWRDCHRKWAFTYISGLPRPPETKAQRIGIALHAKAERFIQTGELDYSSTTEEEKEAARLLPAIVPYLPQGAKSEQKVTITIDGVQFAGRYDWLCRGEVGDLKTTSSLRWAKDETELSTHPQPLIYSKATGADTCRWVYVQTRGAAHVKEVRFKPDFNALPDIVVSGREIVRAWTDRGDPNDYEPNLSACDMYGGCPYKAHCRVDAGKRLAMLLGTPAPEAPTEPPKEPNMPSFDELMAAINPPAPSTAPAPEQPKDVGVTSPPTVENGPVATSGGEQNIGTSEQVPTKRKRRTKAEMAAARAAEQTARAEETPTEVHDTEPPAAPAGEGADDKPIGTLYLSCMPMGETPEFGQYILNAANAEVSEAFGIPDYRAADFAKATGPFVAAVVARVRDIRPESLFLDNRWQETSAVVASLMALSKRVVRGL